MHMSKQLQYLISMTNHSKWLIGWVDLLFFFISLFCVLLYRTFVAWFKCCLAVLASIFMNIECLIGSFQAEYWIFIVKSV